jgi:chemotaxis protein MotA
MELTIEGVLAIQSGSNPRLVAQKLQSMLPSVEQPQKDVA